jgi:hypothetical protein
MTTFLAETGNEGATYSPVALLDVARRYDVIEASDKHLEAGWEIASRLISPDISPLEEYRRIRDHSGVCVIVYEEDAHVTGMYAMLLLNKAGLNAILNKAFDALKPSLEHLATPTDRVFAHYGWGIVATSKTAARAILTAVDEMNRLSFEDVPYYVRAATDNGRRLILKQGCVQVPWNDPDLFWTGGTVREARARQ